MTPLHIQYSPAGPDIPVTTANTTGKTITLTGWTLRALKTHKSVEIHTGTGKNNAANLYWGHKPPSSASYAWNNTGKETAALKNASGKTIDSRGYTGRNVSGAAQAVFKP